MSATPEEILAEEHRRRIPAAVAAICAGILTLLASIVLLAASKDAPNAHLVRALNERLRELPPPGLKAREVLYLNDHLAAHLLAAVIVGLGAAAIGFALTYLYRAAYARQPAIGRPTIVVIVTGAVLLAVTGLVSAIALALETKSFADLPVAEQTGEAARDVLSGPIVEAAGYLNAFGALILGIGTVLVSLKAMSVGLLTRFMGVLGIIVGVISTPLFPLGSSLPFVQVLWLVALGMLFLHRWGGASGVPQAWTTGESHPWPTQQELREARLEAKGGGAKQERKEKPSASTNGKGRGRVALPETPAPELPARPPHSSSKKKKRKRR